VLTIDKRYTSRRLEERLVRALAEEASQLPTGSFCRFVASEGERAIQVADAVAWAIFQKYERDDETFYQIIQDNIVVEDVVKK